MPETYKISVLFNPQDQPAPTAPNKLDEQIPEDVFKSQLQTIGKAAIVGAAITAVKEVVNFRIDTIGLRTGNFDKQQRIQNKIGLYSTLINPKRVIEEVYNFNLANKNSAINASYNNFVSGTLVNGGR